MSEPEYESPFDMMEEEAEKQAKELEAKQNKYDYLIHQVFSQTEEGREILEIWTEALVMSPVVRPGDCQFSAGINEGINTVTRAIISTVKKVENDE